MYIDFGCHILFSDIYYSSSQNSKRHEMGWFVTIQYFSFSNWPNTLCYHSLRQWSQGMLVADFNLLQSNDSGLWCDTEEIFMYSSFLVDLLDQWILIALPRLERRYIYSTYKWEGTFIYTFSAVHSEYFFCEEPWNFHESLFLLDVHFCYYFVTNFETARRDHLWRSSTSRSAIGQDTLCYYSPTM